MDVGNEGVDAFRDVGTAAEEAGLAFDCGVAYVVCVRVDGLYSRSGGACNAAMTGVRA